MFDRIERDMLNNFYVLFSFSAEEKHRQRVRMVSPRPILSENTGILYEKQGNKYREDCLKVGCV